MFRVPTLGTRLSRYSSLSSGTLLFSEKHTFKHDFLPTGDTHTRVIGRLALEAIAPPTCIPSSALYSS